MQCLELATSGPLLDSLRESGWLNSEASRPCGYFPQAMPFHSTIEAMDSQDHNILGHLFGKEFSVDDELFGC